MQFRPFRIQAADRSGCRLEAAADGPGFEAAPSESGLEPKTTGGQVKSRKAVQVRGQV